MKIYTLTGEDGSTSLSGGRRVPKQSIRMEAYGSVDELIAWIGLLRSHKESKSHVGTLLYIQDQLMRCAASLAYDSSNHKIRQILPGNDCTGMIEREIDKMEESLPKLENFILPGGNNLVSYCHIARCVCRRAERAALRLKEAEEVSEIVIRFLNRLSDYLFVLSRRISLEVDNEEVIWSI
jgi:cob(I)alamin adenosyltransferase